ncbi:MAG: pyruvate carboxylase [Roseivirga sp.]|uniref:pyruvate carboxylase n=1 Tax=Roseivirga sp. TaxID=1964215 RepID=UPI001B295934|nr:pyruvate carboxylase [Roseivirga sp.]MBO6659115.1 pyruvate carboxylase [Roseivirga sp.]MBO6761728.1 pyruvate carboxylase [Roseivirga sp.]MBO6908148.1 pyruvate carboxylase [Roseivirga sp.]
MEPDIRKFKKLLVANRGEIAIRVLRAASEMKIRTVAMYTYEDRYSLHRYKADEAYQIGEDDDPLKPYLDIPEIIALAKRENVDAIHPGYGFLSENVNFVRACKEAGITFVGPEPEVMQRLGDKVQAKIVARNAQVPLIEDSKVDLADSSIALAEAQKIGFPVMVKAAAGGGGRGMRVVRSEDQLEKAFNEAKGEAKKAFGDDTIFIEKFIDSPKHIEVQIMGDNYGNLVHLYERDCSVQRRYQKVVEVAPSIGLKDETREKLYKYALRITKEVNYNNVGTVEFLVDAEENIYFIEVNPRVQVEHTITEEITGIDIVRSQIEIAQGYPLDHPRIFIKSQEDVQMNGFAIQCRITTEDPENNFKPDYGTIIAYRSPGGFGIRLDAGNCYAGVTISPFFDSMLVKITATGRTLKGSAQRLQRALSEFRIRGVVTNKGFLENVLNHETFYTGKATVKFIEDHPELFKMPRYMNRATKILNYLGEVAVNGNPSVKKIDPSVKLRTPKVPEFDRLGEFPAGTKQILEKEGPDGLAKWVKDQKQILLTDTTWRDAHQSLLATRMRSLDMLKVAEGFAKNQPNVFSWEMWGGATFDVSMRFLNENPWDRLKKMRAAAPNTLMQMLFRGSNGVGYKAYPDNLIERFIEKSAENGMDVFRIFDSLNWVEAMKVSIRTVRERTNSVAEACICYTGDVLDKNSKYNLQYYMDMAKALEDEGAHMLCIKDMAGLLKPLAATELIGALKNATDLPIHLHTHDTSSMQATTYFKAIEAGVDIVDVAIASMSGLTAQPNFNSLAAALQGHERDPKIDVHNLNKYSTYWEDVREYYYPFESGLKAGTAEVYDHEIPGGQYSNLRPQAAALGLEHKFEEVKRNYALVNQMFGEIVKVTPSSKVVGDMAIFMTSNNLTPQDIMERGHSLSFPESVISLFKGDLGQMPGGFPQELSKIILKDKKPYTERPNAHLEPVDFEKEFEEFQKEFDVYCDELDFLSYKLYPKVFKDFYNSWLKYGAIWQLPTKAFFFAQKQNEEVFVEIGKGKHIIIKMLYIADADESGMRKVYFELNGQTRVIDVRDHNLKSTKPTNRKVDGEHQVGAPLQGRIAEVKVKVGDKVKENQALFVIEAMKMETTVSSPEAGTVKAVYLNGGDMVEQDDLVVELEG